MKYTRHRQGTGKVESIATRRAIRKKSVLLPDGALKRTDRETPFVDKKNKLQMIVMM
jgi:hypothetical protein